MMLVVVVVQVEVVEEGMAVRVMAVGGGNGLSCVRMAFYSSTVRRKTRSQ